MLLITRLTRKRERDWKFESKEAAGVRMITAPSRYQFVGVRYARVWSVTRLCRFHGVVGAWSPRGATRYCQSRPASHSCITRVPARDWGAFSPDLPNFLFSRVSSASRRGSCIMLVWVGVLPQGERRRGKTCLLQIFLTNVRRVH